MNFNIYVDKQTGERLERLAKRRHTSRNKLVREALSHFIERESTAGWPEVVLDFPGAEEAESFEEHRRTLKPARPGPFSEVSSGYLRSERLRARRREYVGAGQVDAARSAGVRSAHTTC